MVELFCRPRPVRSVGVAPARHWLGIPMGNPSHPDLRWSQHAIDECPTAFERFTKPCVPKAIQSCSTQEIASTPSHTI